MFDLSTLVEKQVLMHKCTLLRSLKISFESLMFERSASTSSSWQFSLSSGTLTMFCRHLLDCLLDGANADAGPGGGGGGGVPVAALLWSLVVAVLGSLNEFKSVREQMPSSNGPADSYEVVLTEWIFYSLRHHCLLVQIQSLLAARDTNNNTSDGPHHPLIIARHFNPHAFLLDSDFVHDFLLYIK